MPTQREFFEKNLTDVGLLGGFPSDYRIPHVDKNGVELSVGDEVECTCRTRSWVNGKVGIVLKLGVQSRAGEIEGHLLQMEGSVTVVPIEWVVKREGK